MSENQENSKERIFINEYMAMKMCKHGPMLYNINDTFVGRSLDLYGEWCESELDLLGQILKPGHVVLDVGANIGTHTVFFAKKVTETGFVFAFEPQRLPFQNLCANISLNELLHVKCIRSAVGEEKSTISIPVFNPKIELNFAAISVENHKQGEEVEVLRIDDLNLNRCNLIKVDVEGMENKVLEGARQTITRLRPFLFVENNTVEKSAEVIEKVYSLGYDCYWHIAAYYNPNNHFQNRENIFTKYQPEANMLCCPKNVNIEGMRKVAGVEDDWRKALRSAREKR